MRAPKQWLDLLATLATGIWRLQQRLGPAGAGGSEMRKAVRELESLWDTLGEAGVRIIDPTGDVYDPGQSLKVIAFQPTAGIDRERIVETLKPTVYLGDEWIQMAEVIVGTPKKEDA